MTETTPFVSEGKANSEANKSKTLWHDIAKELSAQLIAHTTSVHNVDLIAAELLAAYEDGRRDGHLHGN